MEALGIEKQQMQRAMEMELQDLRRKTDRDSKIVSVVEKEKESLARENSELSHLVSAHEVRVMLDAI